MANFGDNLRRERELRGVTLAELSNATKISLRYLQALEADRFDGLPGGVINRGFVRSICRYLKLEEKHWVSEFSLASGQVPDLPNHMTSPPVARTVLSQRRTLTWVIVIAVFGGGAFAIHRLQKQQQEGNVLVRAAPPLPTTVMNDATTASDVQERETTTSENHTEPLAVTVTPEETGARPGTVDSETAGVVLVAAKELLLQIDTLEDAWVTISVDGKPTFRGLLKSGETRSFPAKALIELTTGNASAVVLTLNGETLAPLGYPGETKKITLIARNNLPPSPEP